MSVALVAGGGRGIGAAIARFAASRGYGARRQRRTRRVWLPADEAAFTSGTVIDVTGGR